MMDRIRDWSKYKGLRNQLLCIAVGYLPFALIILFLSPPHLILSGSINFIFALINACWLVALCSRLCVSGIGHAHDAENEYSGRFDFGILTRLCAHCELVKY